jgi:hypothetical protein
VSEKLIIGIDPDTDKSGVALLWKPAGNLDLRNLRFFQLYDFLEGMAQSVEKVVIEAGWLNKSNWHVKTGDRAAYAGQIGQRTGANHETGRKIVEMCEYLSLKVELVKPTKSKVDADLFRRLSKYERRTNQEQRDAAMLVLGR